MQTAPVFLLFRKGEDEQVVVGARAQLRRQGRVQPAVLGPRDAARLLADAWQARAAASMSLRAVVPLLLRHLADPSTPNAELPATLTALADMGATEAAPEIDRFVRLYHASADAQLAQAVVAGALALRRLDARRGDALLAHLAGDPFTPDALEGAIARAVELRATPSCARRAR